METKKLLNSLEENGFSPRYFDDVQQAKKAICEELKGEKIAFGGSVTLQEMGIFEQLAENNEVYWHWKEKSPDQRLIEAKATVYLTSANAISESGEIVNIDGTGNRVANSIYGHREVYFIMGANKIAPDLDMAIYRARNFAAPKNAARLNAATPCAVDGKCHNCKSAARICRALTVLMAKPNGVEKCHVIIIGQKLGY